jgi:acetyl-CoA acyltransferase
MDAFIVDYARSPFQFARKGKFAGMRPDDLAAQVVRALVARQPFDAGQIEDILFGCAYPEGEQGDNLARIVGLLAVLPKIPAEACALGWQESLTLLAQLDEPEIPGGQ